MAIEGDMLVIGVPVLDIISREQGTVQIYRFDGDDWHWQQSLISPVQQSDLDERFGYAVAVKDGQIMVGTHGSHTDEGAVPGSVYVFALAEDGEGWTHLQTLQPPDDTLIDSFGSSLSVDGSWLLIGAPVSQQEMMHEAGKAYVYQKSEDETWSYQAVLSSDGPESTTAFGWTVSISGDRAVVGDPNFEAQGQVDIFQYNGSDWFRSGQLNPPDTDLATDFGFDVLIDGDLLVVGSPDDGSEQSGQGGVFVYRYQQGGWALDGQLLDPEADDLTRFGQNHQSGPWKFGHRCS